MRKSNRFNFMRASFCSV